MSEHLSDGLDGLTLTVRVTLPRSGKNPKIPKACQQVAELARSQGAGPGDTVAGTYRRVDGVMVLQGVELVA